MLPLLNKLKYFHSKVLIDQHVDPNIGNEEVGAGKDGEVIFTLKFYSSMENNATNCISLLYVKLLLPNYFRNMVCAICGTITHNLIDSIIPN